MAHGDAREGKWRGNWQMEWLASTLHTTSEHGVTSVTTADAHTSAASSRLNWCPRWIKWNCPFCRKTKSGFCAYAITFQLAFTADSLWNHLFWQTDAQWQWYISCPLQKRKYRTANTIFLCLLSKMTYLEYYRNLCTTIHFILAVLYMS
jgi:hypothetical protein